VEFCKLACEILAKFTAENCGPYQWCYDKAKPEVYWPIVNKSVYIQHNTRYSKSQPAEYLRQLDHTLQLIEISWLIYQLASDEIHQISTFAHISADKCPSFSYLHCHRSARRTYHLQMLNLVRHSHKSCILPAINNTHQCRYSWLKHAATQNGANSGQYNSKLQCGAKKAVFSQNLHSN